MTNDPHINSLINLLASRSEVGYKKYGVGLDRTDLKPSEWCQHAIEEALDKAGYLMRLKADLEALGK